MRTFSTAVSSAFNNDKFKYFFLIKLELNTTYYFTSHSSDIDWAGQTWTSDGGVFEFDSPKFSSILDREAYRVVITDLVDQLSQEFRVGVVGKNITVYVGIVDHLTGLPLTGAGDIINLYKGYVDAPAIENDWDTKFAVIEGTSPMADLDMVRSTMASKDGRDQVSLTDSCCDYLYEDSEINLKWGKTNA